MTDFNEISTKWEAVKIGMRHTKDGHVISFACHPNDTPHELMADPLGQRYLLVAVRLNQQDEPVPSPEQVEGANAVKLAGALCSDDKFRDWLIWKGYIDDATENAAAAWMRRQLDIVSRKELKENKRARFRLAEIRDEFIADYKTGRIR